MKTQIDGGASVEGNNGYRNRDPKDEFYISPRQTQTALIIYSIKAHILRDMHMYCLVNFECEPKICLLFLPVKPHPNPKTIRFGNTRLTVSQTINQFFFSSPMIHTIPSLKHVTMTLKVKRVTFGDF